MTIGRVPVTLHAFPRHDLGFVAALEQIARDVEDLLDLGPEFLEGRLRQTYPSVVVHPKDPLGSLMPSETAWYVYRDGSPLT